MKIQFSPIFSFNLATTKDFILFTFNTQHGFFHRKYIKVSWAMPIIVWVLGGFEFQKLVEQKLLAIMKGNFSAVSVKRIREKPKTDPP
jgi:hypothetical protein